MSGLACSPSPPSPSPFDPAFKLFGTTIPVSSPPSCKQTRIKQECHEPYPVPSSQVSFAYPVFSEDTGDQAPDSDDEKFGASGLDELGSSSGSNDGCDGEKPNDGMGTGDENPSTLVEGDTQKSRDNSRGDESEGALKKPDKPTPCPRCDSLDTKFCYFNNYNVNQPRHFCKNCQRYWTAGGTLRNVPVGAGRRKNKPSIAHLRSTPENLAVRGDPLDGAQPLLSCTGSSAMDVNRHLKVGTSAPRPHLLAVDVPSFAAFDSPVSSTVLNFGQGSPLAESIGATSRHVHRSEVLQERGRSNGKACCPPLEGDAGSSAPAGMDSRSLDIKKHIQGQNCVNRPINMSHQASSGWQPVGHSACIPAAQPVELRKDSGPSTELPAKVDTAFGWSGGDPFTFIGGPCQCRGNVGWNNIPVPANIPVATATATSSILSTNTTSANQTLGIAAVNPPPWAGAVWPGFPWPLMQSTMWGPPAWGGAWVMPWASAAAAAVGAAAAAAAAANPMLGSQTLGKRPLEQGEYGTEKRGSLWVPKTLRIDDPVEAAQSSIWTTLGLENRRESTSSSGIFSAFQPRTGSKEVDDPHVQDWHTNPAAMSRSIAFQESN